MAKLEKNNDKVTIDDLMDAIASSNLWIVSTITETSTGATVSIRESHKGAMIDTIALLLEQKEIYEAVQKKIAKVRLKEKSNKNPNTDIN